MIDYISYFICFVICLFNMTWIYGNLTNNKLNFSKKKILLIFILTILSTLIYSLNYVVLKMINSIVCLIILAKISYRDSVKKTLFYSFVVWGFGMFFDLLFMLLFSFFMDYFNFTDSFYIPLEYFVTLLLQLIYNLISRTKLSKKVVKFFYDLFNQIDLYLIFFFIICMVYIGYKSVLNFGDFSKEIAIFIMGIFALWIIIQTLYVIYIKKINNETYMILQNNNKFYVEKNIEFRIFKHNLLHKLDAVKSYSNNTSKVMLNEIIDEFRLLKQSNIELDKLPAGINGLIQKKLYGLFDNDAQVLVDNNVTQDILELIKTKNYIKLCEILGVVLDNALEAMKDCKDKIIFISIDENDSEIIFVVKNTFSSCIDIDKLGNFNYTTKGAYHGVGLFSILLRNKIKPKLKIVNNMFETKIVVSKIKKE